MQSQVELTGVHPRIDKLLEIESRYPVNTWKVNDLHIWPVVRTRLYIEMAIEELQVKYDKSAVATTKSTEQTKSTGRIPDLFNRIQNQLAAFWFSIRPMSEIPALFVTPASYNDQFEGKWYHKFFDPIRITRKEYHQCPILEIGKSPSGQLNNAIHLDTFKRVLDHYDRYHRSQIMIMHLDGFESFMEEIGSITSVAKRINRRALSEAYYAIKKHEDFFTTLIRKRGIKELYGLCYYLDSYVMMGMNAAAYHSNVQSIDIQHGGQGPVHIGYSKFNRLPDSGFYEVMPGTFWCWDEASRDEIGKWADKTISKHKAIVGGQPWLNFIKSRLAEKTNGQKVILVTLQPHGELVPEVILKAIPQCGTEYQWIIRLHPRTLSRRNELEGILASYHLNAYIHPATWNMPSLPESIAISSLHISRTSGSVIEASLLNVPNIVIDPVGADLYKDLIQRGKATDASQLDHLALAALIKGILQP